MTELVKFYFRIFLITSVVFCSGCGNTASQITVVGPPALIEQEQVKLTVPTDTSQAVFAAVQQKAAVSRYYQTYGNDPMWIVDGHYNDIADSMLSIIRNAKYYGLLSNKYHLSELEDIFGASVRVNSVRGELLLTDAFLSFAGDVKFGVRDMSQKRNEDTIRIELLNRVALHGDLKKNLEFNEPAFQGYKLLKEGLRVLLDSADTYYTDSASLTQKIRLISINLERWRREKIALNDRYIFINIPSFMLNVVDRDSTVLSSRVIVGTPDTETPILSSVVECFSIYPYWHVPRKISVEEYLPILKKDTTFLRRNNFDVLDRRGNILNADSVQWNKFTTNYFPVVLTTRGSRKLPGSD